MLSVDQYDAFSYAAQIHALETRAVAIDAARHSNADKRSVRTSLSSIEAKIALLRRGRITEEELLDVHMDVAYGPRELVQTDRDIEALGFKVIKAPKKEDEDA